MELLETLVLLDLPVQLVVMELPAQQDLPARLVPLALREQPGQPALSLELLERPTAMLAETYIQTQTLQKHLQLLQTSPQETNLCVLVTGLVALEAQAPEQPTALLEPEAAEGLVP